jgi:hypothetical protein
MKTPFLTASVRWLLPALVLVTNVLAQEVGIASGPAKASASHPDFQRISVREIVANPPSRGTKVEVYGTTDTVASPKRGRASMFILKGDEGGQITVESNRQFPPTPGTRRDPLFATVQFEPGADGVLVPFLIEALDVGSPVPAVVDARPATAPPPAAPTLLQRLSNPYVLAGVVVVALLVIIIVLASKPKAPAAAAVPPPPPPPAPSAPMASAAPPVRYAPPAADEEDEITIRKNDVTVRVQEEATREFFPLHLIIRIGGGDGRQIPLCSSVGGGRTITIGRRKKDSPLGASFIGLEDSTHALSGKQVKLTYDKPSGKVLLENQSGVNPTTIDGNPLGIGETVTLRPGMKIGLPPDYALEVRQGAHFPSSR